MRNRSHKWFKFDQTSHKGIDSAGREQIKCNVRRIRRYHPCLSTVSKRLMRDWPTGRSLRCGENCYDRSGSRAGSGRGPWWAVVMPLWMAMRQITLWATRGRNRSGEYFYKFELLTEEKNKVSERLPTPRRREYSESSPINYTFSRSYNTIYSSSFFNFCDRSSIAIFFFFKDIYFISLCKGIGISSDLYDSR